MEIIRLLTAMAAYVASLWGAAVLYVDGHAVAAAAVAAVGIGYFISPWLRPGRRSSARNKRWAILKEGSYGNTRRPF